MKGSKSKGKTAVQAPPPAVVAARRGRKRRTGPPPINNLAKEFTVVRMEYYLQSKVVFNIGQVDPILARSLVYAFNNSRYDLAQSSLLLQLKVQKMAKFEVTYRHDLDTHEALLLYTRLMRRRKGDVNELEQLQDLVELIKLLSLQSKDLDESFEKQRHQLNKDVDALRRTVKTRFNALRDSVRNSFPGSDEHFKAELLEARIREIAGDLINLMVVAVREIAPNKVQVIFQQPYPQKTCAPKFLINAIGQSRYLKKKCNFVKFYQEARINHRSNTNFIVCHVCKEVLLDSYLRCVKTEPFPFIPTYHNSPNTYHRHLIAIDYCYHPATEFNKKQMDAELDYFKYYSIDDGQYSCNRFVCRKCSENWVLLDTSKEIFAYNCPFCLKKCICSSCLLAQELVKALALYKDILLRNQQGLSKYEELVRFVNLDHEDDVEVYKRIRCTFKAPDRRQYYEYYMNTLESFASIVNVMEQYQAEAVRSMPLFKEIQPMITEEMVEIRTFFQSLKQQHKNKQSNATPKKSLARVRGENAWFQQQLQKKKEMQKFQENLLIKSLNGNNKSKQKQMTLKDKFLSECALSKYTSKFQVPFEPADLTQHEQFLEGNQLTQLQYFLSTKLKPVDPSLVGRITTMKKEVPFEEMDYQLAANVKSECRIIKERDIQLKKNTDKRIMYTEDHPAYGFKGVESNRFHKDSEEFMYALYRIDSSDSQEAYQGLSPPIDPGSVSLSSHFLREHGVVRQEPVAQASQIDDAVFESASSSFMLLGEANAPRQQNREPMQQQK